MSALPDQTDRTAPHGYERRIMVEDQSATLPPRIRLKGRWLVELAGFEPGRQVRVVVTGPGRIVIDQLQT